MVGNHARLFAPGAQRVPLLRERELRRHELRRAAVGIDERGVFGFLRVLDVVSSFGERFYDALAIRAADGDNQAAPSLFHKSFHGWLVEILFQEC